MRSYHMAIDVEIAAVILLLILCLYKSLISEIAEVTYQDSLERTGILVEVLNLRIGRKLDISGRSLRLLRLSMSSKAAKTEAWSTNYAGVFTLI